MSGSARRSGAVTAPGLASRRTSLLLHRTGVRSASSCARAGRSGSLLPADGARRGPAAAWLSGCCWPTRARLPTPYGRARPRQLRGRALPAEANERQGEAGGPPGSPVRGAAWGSPAGTGPRGAGPGARTPRSRAAGPCLRPVAVAGRASRGRRSVSRQRSHSGKRSDLPASAEEPREGRSVWCRGSS